MQRDTSSNLIPRFFYAGFSPGSDAFAAALFGLVHCCKVSALQPRPCFKNAVGRLWIIACRPYRSADCDIAAADHLADARVKDGDGSSLFCGLAAVKMIIGGSLIELGEFGFAVRAMDIINVVCGKIDKGKVAAVSFRRVHGICWFGVGVVDYASALIAAKRSLIL